MKIRCVRFVIMLLTSFSNHFKELNLTAFVIQNNLISLPWKSFFKMGQRVIKQDYTL